MRRVAETGLVQLNWLDTWLSYNLLAVTQFHYPLARVRPTPAHLLQHLAEREMAIAIASCTVHLL